MKIGTREFDVKNQFYMVGILNITPDSFSDGGQCQDLDQALKHAERLIKDGADMLDIGGESTRPEHKRISEIEEIERICPIIEMIKENFEIPISLDTYKNKVAKAGIEAGADFINDIWGLKWDKDMAGVIRDADIPCCLMHNKRHTLYDNIIKDIKKDLEKSIEIAKKAGIAQEKIILDPGIGFAKDFKTNLKVMKRLGELQSLGYPLMLGTSRKSMIGTALNLPVNEREEGTLATSVIGFMAGFRFFRGHDVKANLRGIQMAKAILEA